MCYTKHMSKATKSTINERRLLQHFFQYVKISSPSHQEGNIRTVLRSQLVKLKAKTKVDAAGNLIAYIPAQGSPASKVPLLLSAHMDTVKPCKRIRPVVRGEVIMTDGKSVLGADDKAGIAAIMETIQRLQETKVNHPALEIVFSTGEETFSDGASELDYSLLHAPHALVVDGGDIGDIDYKSAYMADVHATIKGKAAHSGIEPEKGVSAIQIAALAISKMKLGRIDAETTANIGLIRGGSIRNAIPAKVKLHGEARSFSKRKIEDQLERMYKALQDACEEYGGLLDLNSKVVLDGYTVKKSHPFLKHVAATMANVGLKPKLLTTIGATDANAFMKHGIISAVIGTGVQMPHTVEEHIRTSDLTKLTELIYAIVQSYAEQRED